MTSSRERTGAAYLLDKARGPTSRRASSGVARAWGFSKFGHAGTLDPDATGLLIVLMGKATRLSRFFLNDRKSYSFAIELGLRTDTDDLTGRVLERRPFDGITRQDLEDAMKHFTGCFPQKVPDFSAVRVEGVRAYSMARKGQDPETPVRQVCAGDWKLLDWDGKSARFSVTVSSGTYVRALARDIGERLGTLGTAFDIRRTAVGSFTVDEASGQDDDPESLLTMSGLMRDLPAVELLEEESESVAHGAPLPNAAEGLVRMLDPNGSLIAVSEGDGEELRPLCVLVER